MKNVIRSRGPFLEGKLKRLRRLIDEYLQPKERGRDNEVRQNPDLPVSPHKHWDEYAGRYPFQPTGAKKTLVVVVHEASRTGAPKTGLELGQSLSETHQIVFIVMKSGPLLPDFLQSGSAVFVPRPGRGENLVAHLSTRFDVKCAILNSLVTARYAAPFHTHGVPSVTYAHEFSQTISKEVSSLAHRWSTKLVFSTPVTRETFSWLDGRAVEILPQGLKKIGAGGHNGTELLDKIATNPKSKVVIGAGTVIPRKGIDLFIETCRKIKEIAPSNQYFFVWLGGDLNSSGELGYLLETQVNLSGLHGDLHWVPDADVRPFLERANAFLMTSRLDPLPNVALEALLSGCPALFFDGTTGVPDLLQLGTDFVSSGLDTSDMAEKTVNLLDSSPHLRQKIESIKSLTASYTDFTEYVGRFLALIDDASAQHLDDKVKSVELQKELTRHGLKLRSFQTDSSAFLRARNRDYASTHEPLETFSSRFFTLARPDVDIGPEGLLQYLKDGRPPGIWDIPLIRPQDGLLEEATNKSVIHLHSWLPTDVEEILLRIAELDNDVDVIVTTVAENTRAHENLAHSCLQGRKVQVVTTHNSGRNFGPLRELALTGALQGYSTLVHVHNKMTPHVSRGFVREWRKDLFDALIRKPIFDAISSSFTSDATLGMVYPFARSAGHWNKNLKLATALASEFLVDRLPREPDYPIGGMFAMRVALIEEIFKHPSLDGPLLQPEPLSTDGEYVHAFERLLPILAAKYGYRVAKSLRETEKNEGLT